MVSPTVKSALVALATVFAASSLPAAPAEARDRHDRRHDYRHDHRHDNRGFWNRPADRFFQPSPWYTQPYVTVPVVPYVVVPPREYYYDEPRGPVVRCFRRDEFTGQRYSIPCPPSVLNR